MKWNWMLRVRQGTCLLIGASVLAGCGLFMSEEALLKRAQDAYQRGELRAATIDLKSLLEKHPQNREARFLLGQIDLDAGDVASAVRDFERARKDGVPDARVVLPLARAYQAQREFDKALSLLDQADAANLPADEKVNRLRTRGEILFAKREFAQARSVLESALSDSPNDVRSLLALAGVVEASEGSEPALKVADRALAAAPNDGSVHLARGALLLQMKRAEEALTSFQKAADVATAPTAKSAHLAALSGLAQSQLLLGRTKEALETSATMQSLAPNLPVTRYTRAYALAQNGELEPARELLEQNVSQVEDVRSRLLLGAVDLNLGRYAQAEIQLSSVVAAMPNNAEARQLLAEARLKQAKPSDALDALIPALEGGAGANANLLALAGQASLAAGKVKEGVALLKRNADANPKNERAQLDLAAGYLAAGQTDQALALLGGANGTNGADADKQGDSETQLVRREYLNVLARMQKGDAAGAAAHATKVAQEQSNNAALQTLASAVLITQRQYSKARPFAEAAVKLRPDEAAGYTNLGRLSILEGKPDEARKNFRVALDKQPGDAVAATSLALLEMSGQKPDAALSILSDLRKHNAKSVEPRVLETQILLSRGQADAAEKLARETVSFANDNATALAALGRVLSTEGRHGEALETFERAVKLQAKNAPLRFQLAVAQRMAGREDDALVSAREALKIDERYVPALQLDGLLSVAKKDLEHAGKRADELMKIAPEQASTHELLAVLRNAQQRFADAAAAYRRAGEFNPLPQYAIGEFQARVQGKLPNAEEPLDKYVAAHPNEPTTRTVLAQAQQARGDRAAAASSYEAVLKSQPKNALALNNLAWMRFEDGKTDALDLAQRAYNAAPNSFEVADTYAWILVNSGKVNDGLKVFESVFVSAKQRSATPLADIRAHYAVALSRAGRDTEAKAIAREVTTTDAAQLSPAARTMLADLIKS